MYNKVKTNFFNNKNNCTYLPRRMCTCVRRNKTMIQVELTFRKGSIILSNSTVRCNKLLNLWFGYPRILL